MKILLASSEATPFIKSGGLADVAGSLSNALCQNGEDCRIVLPLYEDIPEDLRKKMTYLLSFYVPLSWRNQYCGVFTAKAGKVTYYFLDNEYYFKRRGLYGFFDDAERFAFFSKSILEMLAYIDFSPQIIHCNDWQTALIPVYLNLFFRKTESCKNLKTIFTIHNIQYQGAFALKTAQDVCGLEPNDIHVVEYNGDANFMKGGIEEADQLTTVSPTYAKEILDPWFSYGLDPLLSKKQDKLIGILNGIDYSEYSPVTDPFLTQKYSAQNPLGKTACKKALCEELGLSYDPNAMILAMITRLTNQKGMDLICQVFDRIMDNPIQFILLGAGDWQYENYFREAANRYHSRVSATLGFDEALAHRIYAGADCFLMPSKSEPCGLSQMIALSYGTIPIVRQTGGLADSIRDLGAPGGNGYTFQTYYAEDMLTAIGRACLDFPEQKKWGSYVQNALASNFSWEESAKSYSKIYASLLH